MPDPSSAATLISACKTVSDMVTFFKGLGDPREMRDPVLVCKRESLLKHKAGLSRGERQYLAEIEEELGKREVLIVKDWLQERCFEEGHAYNRYKDLCDETS